MHKTTIGRVADREERSLRGARSFHRVAGRKLRWKPAQCHLSSVLLEPDLSGGQLVGTTGRDSLTVTLSKLNSNVLDSFWGVSLIIEFLRVMLPTACGLAQTAWKPGCANPKFPICTFFRIALSNG